MSTSIPASQQFRAVAHLRWCLFRNGFRRKGGKGELAARIVVYPIALLMLLGPVTGAFLLSYAAASQKGHQNLGLMVPIFWGIFLLQLVVSINISPPGLSFDPESLIRFPVTFPRYLSIRLVLGLLSASTIAGTGALFAAALGVTVGDRQLGSVAFIAAFILALSNMLFNRMLFAWVDRWLSTRRARELFTFFIVAVSLFIQYINVTFNGFGRHVNHRDQRAKIDAAVNFYHRVQPVLAALPPGQAASAIVNSSQDSHLAAGFNLLGVLLSAVIFFVIFAWRMQREYRGENLSEVNHSPAAKPVAAASPTRQLALAPASPAARNGLLPPEILAAMQKEWIYIRRNPAQLYGLIIPLAMVFLFTARANTMAHNQWIFPGAVAYSLMGISAQAYNSLGLDASGIQFYFLAPVTMRSIFLAKNLLGFAINVLQIVLIFTLLTFTAGAPSLIVTVATICWAIFSALVNITFGNMRSITAPKRVDPSKMSRRQASQLSGLISVALTLIAAAIGFGIFGLGAITGLDWLPIPILLALDGGAFALYVASLSRLDDMVQNNRETILEELTKVAV